MKQLLPKLKKINCQKLISKKKSQIDRASLPMMKIWGKEIRKFQFLYKWEDEAMIS